MDSALVTVFLPIALGIVMAGLGLELTPQDFSRVRKHPKAVFVALFCQLGLLVGIAFALCKIFALQPLLAVGLMLLAASPGGATANLLSYLFKGDIALNITLTAINSILAAFTLPIVVNFAINHFMQGDQQIGLQFAKVVQVFVIIIVPVLIGMLIRHYSPRTAEMLNKPTRIFAVVFLVVIILGAIMSERENILNYIGEVGVATALFCAISLSIGYFVPRMFGISAKQARASAFEIGIHNGTLAITIAITIMASTTIAMPAAVYSIFMYFFAVAFGFMLNRIAPLPAETSAEQINHSHQI